MTDPAAHPLIVDEPPAPYRPVFHPNRLLAAGATAVIGAVILLGAIFGGAFNHRAASDQADYHLRVIEQFSRELPRPNLSDYRSATGPGYHLVLAAVHRWVTNDVQALRVVGASFTVGLLAILGWYAGGRVRWPRAVALCLPMCTSLYVFVSGAWLLPDNLAWLTILIALLIAFRPHVDELTFITAGLLLVTAVFVRQINLWPLGVLVVGALLGPYVVVHDNGRVHVEYHFSLHRSRAGLMLLMGIPAALVLAWFYWLWKGLTPPAFQAISPGTPLPPGHSGWQHEGPNPAVPAMVLAVLGATGLFFAPLLWPTTPDVLARRGRALKIVGAGLLLGAATALVVPTDFTPAPGPRYSGLWNVSAHFPVVAHRSLLIAGLAAAGGTWVALWFLALGPRDRWIWLSAWACFTVAQTANAMAWQKYYEPFCLMMLALAAARAAPRQRPAWWAFAGPVALAALLAYVTLWTLSPPPPPAAGA